MSPIFYERIQKLRKQKRIPKHVHVVPEQFKLLSVNGKWGALASIMLKVFLNRQRPNGGEQGRVYSNRERCKSYISFRVDWEQDEEL